MPRSSALCAALLVAVTLGSSVHARPNLRPHDLSRLAAYDVLLFADPYQGGIERSKAISVIDGTPEEVFRVASDYARWRDFLPQVRGSQVLSTTRSGAVIRVTADLPWPVGRSQVEVRHTHEKLAGEIYRIRFEMVQGNMKKYLGSLYIEPWLYNKATLTFELVAEPDSWAPRSTVNKLVRRTASSFVHALRQRIHDLHSLGYLHPLPNPRPAAPPPLPSPEPTSAKLQP